MIPPPASRAARGAQRTARCRCLRRPAVRRACVVCAIPSCDSLSAGPIADPAAGYSRPSSHLREISTKSPRNDAAPATSPANPVSALRDQRTCRCTAASDQGWRWAGLGRERQGRRDRRGRRRGGGQDEQSRYCSTRNPYCLFVCIGSAAPLVAPPDPIARPVGGRPGRHAATPPWGTPALPVCLPDARGCRLQPARLLIADGGIFSPTTWPVPALRPRT